MLTVRPTGKKWRRRAYARLVDRDGEVCAACKTQAKVLWRSAGLTTAEWWGPEPWDRSLCSMVMPTSSLEVEHIVALRYGGTNDPSNLRLLCTSCHKVKTAAERRLRQVVQ